MALQKNRDRSALGSVSLEHDISFVDQLFPDGFWSDSERQIASLNIKEIAEASYFLNLPENKNLKKRIYDEPERFYYETLAYTPILRFFKDDHIDSRSVVLAYEKLKNQKPYLPSYLTSNSLPQSLIYNIPEAYEALLGLPEDEKVLGCYVADVMLSNANFINHEAPVLFNISLALLSFGESLVAQSGVGAFSSISAFHYRKWVYDSLVNYYPKNFVIGYSLEQVNLLDELISVEDPICRQKGFDEVVNFNVQNLCHVNLLSSIKSETFISVSLGGLFFVPKPLLDLTFRGFRSVKSIYDLIKIKISK